MPELPEVENIVHGLRALLPGRTIQAVAVCWPRTVACPSAEAFVAGLSGRQLTRVGRRGKYVVIGLDSGSLLIHLKMSGRLRLVLSGEPYGAHTRLSFDLDSGMQLRFDDARKFGRAYLVADPAQVTGELGPEPLDASFTLEEFRRSLGRRSGRLKPLLLNQKFLAGLGNIYADEVLFWAGLHPLRRASLLSEEEQARLYEAIRGVLEHAIVGHGTTLDDAGYMDAEGNSGRYQEQIAVYGREGKPCRRCGTPIQRFVIGQRSSHFCPSCQPERMGL